jgi:type IV secretion system protein VirB9
MKSATMGALAALLCQMQIANALERPQPAVPLDKGGDPHVRIATYNPADQVLLVGEVGRGLTVTFAPDEHVVSVVLEMGSVRPDGNKIPAPWKPPQRKQIQSNPLDNILPLWPIRPGRSTAQVITRKADGTQRIYQLALVALPEPESCDKPTDGGDFLADCDDPRMMTGVTFVYPKDAKKAKAARAAVAHKRQEKAKAEERLKTDIFYGDRNWKYIAQGTEEAVRLLAPDEVSDNSQVTGFRYLGRRHVPAIYIVEHGKERLTTPEPDQDLLVVHETAYHWRLRAGSDSSAVLDIYNEDFNPVGVNPWTGTTSPNVTRVVKK